MDCPVCKYPNTPGATHCGMCYEVFNRSAAQNYLHAVKKERRDTEGVPEESPVVIKSEKILDDTKAIVAKIDWKGLSDTALSLLKRAKVPLLAIAGVTALWMLASFLFSASLWYHVFGKKFVYTFSDQSSAQYLVGMKQGVKIWSERQGRLDTPMSDSKIDEIGNVLLVTKKGTAKNGRTVFVNTKEWIQVLTDSAGSASHTLPKNHPSLAGARLVFNKKGSLIERHVMSSHRLAKSIPFLIPKFPNGSLRHGKTWDESVEWLDVYNDWKIGWTATIHWTLGELESCDNDSCAKLTYTADLEPHLLGEPAWAQGVTHHVEAQPSTEGTALFDVSRGQLISNIFSYDGVLRVPLRDLGRIPWELRIGRRVKNQAGDIMIRFENNIDIRRN